MQRAILETDKKCAGMTEEELVSYQVCRRCTGPACCLCVYRAPTPMTVHRVWCATAPLSSCCETVAAFRIVSLRPFASPAAPALCVGISDTRVVLRGRSDVTVPLLLEVQV